MAPPSQRFIFVIEGSVKVEVDGKSSKLGVARLRLLARRITSPSGLPRK